MHVKWEFMHAGTQYVQRVVQLLTHHGSISYMIHQLCCQAWCSSMRQFCKSGNPWGILPLRYLGSQVLLFSLFRQNCPTNMVDNVAGPQHVYQLNRLVGNAAAAITPCLGRTLLLHVRQARTIPELWLIAVEPVYYRDKEPWVAKQTYIPVLCSIWIGPTAGRPANSAVNVKYLSPWVCWIVCMQRQGKIMQFNTIMVILWSAIACWNL